MDVKSIVVTRPMANPIGALAGGVGFYLIAKKGLKLENKWAVWGIALVGVLAGATIQAKMSADASLKKTISVKS